MTTDQPLNKRFVKYFSHQPKTWVAKGDLDYLVVTKTDHNADYGSRVLRDMAMQGRIKVKYDNRNNAWYSLEGELSKEEENHEAIRFFDKEGWK